MGMAIYTTELLTDRDYNIPEGRLPLEYAVDQANKAKTHSEDAAAHVSADSIKNIVPIAWMGEGDMNLPTVNENKGIALGFNTYAGGYAATAIGADAQAKAGSSVALGRETLASSDSAIAIGKKAQAHYSSNIAIGENSHSALSKSIAVGSFASANSNGGIAIGSSASVKNYDSIAIGASTSASGDYATAIGYMAEAKGTDAVAIGKFAKSLSPRSIAIGELAMGGANIGQNAISIGYCAEAAYFSLALGNNARAVPNMGLGCAIGSGANCDSNRSMAIGHGATNKDDASLLLTASHGSGANFSMQLKAGIAPAGDGDLNSDSPFSIENYLIFTVEDTLTDTKQTAKINAKDLFNMLKQFGAEVTFDKGGDGYYSGAENY